MKKDCEKIKKDKNKNNNYEELEIVKKLKETENINDKWKMLKWKK